MTQYFKAVIQLVGEENFIGGRADGPIDKIRLKEGTTAPTEEAIQAKLTELNNAEPMRVLRTQRNRKLAETDWWCCSDRNATQAQLDYRTALRDLPANNTPSLDENGDLTGVNWPSKPE